VRYKNTSAVVNKGDNKYNMFENLRFQKRIVRHYTLHSPTNR